MKNLDFEKIVENPFVIYGAQVVAYGAYRAISELYSAKPECFLVSSQKNNPFEIDGIKVKTPKNIDKGITVLVCVTELLQDEIETYLINMGFENVIRLTRDLEYELMSLYFAKDDRFPVAEANGNNDVNFLLYEVRNHRDKPLRHTPKLQHFEKSLQAGADLTDLRIGYFTDNTGNNISAKNKQYCETTGTYWVWKNTKSAWKGIEHYRRHLLVVPEMLSDEIDAILPLPYICYPNTVTQFRRFVSEEVLECLLKALRDLHRDKYDDYYKILYGEFQYTYNLVIAKEKVFNDYCSWFFEITEYMEAMSDKTPEILETRALSYAAEVLTNLYFMYNSNRLNIRHVKKAIYV